jgi:sensor histidine kinase YesM
LANKNTKLSILWEYFVPPMLIQPLVENAVIHGLSPKTENAQLSIFISQHKGLLKLVIQDNGIGRKAAAQPNPYKTAQKKTSIGLKNLQERLDISKQIYGLIITYHIEDLENNLERGTKITLLIHPKT